MNTIVSKSELKLKQLLDNILPTEEHFDNYRPDWLKNPETGFNLELDRFYPNLNIGIEFNGPQHRKKNNEAQWNRDRIKKHLCAKQGVIRLVFYANELNEQTVCSKLKDVSDMRECWQQGLVWAR
jgi:hypothetical protein